MKIKKTELFDNGLESITDELIEKLNKEKGMPIKDLKEFQKQGAKYSAFRNSFFFPPKLELFE
ncbi:MAG: hypothetical protein GY739_15765 [Mesoflavibacter sp.]|nr:hypothetical protein [Mesoflavibacter sp.]